MKRLLFCCILVVSCNHSARSSDEAASTTPSAVAAGTPSNAKECKLPSSWTAAGAKMGASFPSPVDELVVLDWRVRSDAPMLVSEEAFVWCRGHEEAGAFWLLATLHRNPKAENEWRLAANDDAPVTPQARFDHAPSSAEVDAFLKDSTWTLHQRAPQDTAGRRCDAAWTRLVGVPPPPLPE